jgi:hypothetical protein
MDRIQEIFGRAFGLLDADAVAAIGSIRWLSGMADPETETAPQGLSSRAAAHLGDMLLEYAEDPLAWVAYFGQLEGVAFDG